MDLLKISQEIKDLIELRRKNIRLSFIEEDHVYFMEDKNGQLRNDFPSVSKVLKEFYVPFDANLKSFQMSGGDVYLQKELIDKWKKAGDYSTNMGSRVHYILEDELIKRNNSYKEIRKPIFECDDTQIQKGDMMITAGKKYLDLLQKTGIINMLAASPYLYMGKDSLKRNHYNVDNEFFDDLVDMSDDIKGVMIRGAMNMIEDEGKEISVESVTRVLRRYAPKVLTFWMKHY